jgi:hypothetical protein
LVRDEPRSRGLREASGARLLNEARGVLTDMLTRNDVPESQKELIFDALKADREIPRGGVAVSH